MKKIHRYLRSKDSEYASLSLRYDKVASSLATELDRLQDDVNLSIRNNDEPLICQKCGKEQILSSHLKNEEKTISLAVSQEDYSVTCEACGEYLVSDLNDLSLIKSLESELDEIDYELNLISSRVQFEDTCEWLLVYKYSSDQSQGG